MRFRTMATIANADNELCIGFPVFGSANPGDRLVQKSCSQTGGWRLVPQNANGTDPLMELQSLENPGLCMAAANTLDNNQTPLVALPCDFSFQNAGQILQLG